VPNEVDAFDGDVRRAECDARRTHRLDREEAYVPRVVVKARENVAGLLVTNERDARIERARQLAGEIRRDPARAAVVLPAGQDGLPKLIAARSTPLGASSIFAASFIPTILRELSPMPHCGYGLQSSHVARS
jgi:hypothetical protein